MIEGRANKKQNGIPIIVFVIEPDENERVHICGIIDTTGCAVIQLPSVEHAIQLLSREAACHLIVLSVDAIADKPELFDTLIQLHRPGPPIIMYGINPNTKLALHCLNRGVSDFLAKPFDDDELINAVLNAISDDADRARSKQTDAIQASSHISGWIELTASSELEQFRRLQRFYDALFASQFPDDVCEDLKMAIEEVGRNAVEWGNNFNPDKQVHISYCLFSDRVVIKVQDEGEGFTPDTLPDPTADPLKTMRDRKDAGKRPGGYGLYLLRKIMDSIVYNEKGNTVLLIKYLPSKDRPSNRLPLIDRSNDP